MEAGKGTTTFLWNVSGGMLSNPLMPRTARASHGGCCYHVLNRGNARNEVVHKREDYAAFVKLLGEANQCVSMRLLADCLMPTIFIWSFGPVTMAI